MLSAFNRVRAAVKPSTTADCLLLGFLASFLWTLAGCGLAFLQSRLQFFIEQWILLQGFFAILFGTVLASLYFFDNLDLIARGLEINEYRLSQRVTVGIMLFVTVVGTASLVSLGFPGDGLILAFMLVTCGIICFLASFATVQALEILMLSRELVESDPKLHMISPAETPCIRMFAEYATFFGVVITIGYAFAFVGTIMGNWQSSTRMVVAVQTFWPLIYVPLCLTVLFLPHAHIYSVIRAKKDAMITQLQGQMGSLSSSTVLSKDQVDQINALADLINKIEKAPNYPSNLRIFAGITFTTFINISTILIPRDLVTEVVRRTIGN